VLDAVTLVHAFGLHAASFFVRAITCSPGPGLCFAHAPLARRTRESVEVGRACSSYAGIALTTRQPPILTLLSYISRDPFLLEFYQLIMERGAEWICRRKTVQRLGATALKPPHSLMQRKQYSASAVRTTDKGIWRLPAVVSRKDTRLVFCYLWAYSELMLCTEMCASASQVHLYVLTSLCCVS